MKAAALAPATPASERPLWIPADTWERMPWAARMRAARRVLHVVRTTETGDGAVSTGQADAPQADEALRGSDARTAPSSPDPEPTYPCAIGCGRWTRLVYCEPCAELHRTEDATPPPLWLTAAWGNRLTLDRQARANGGHVLHPRSGGPRHAPNRYRVVTP